MKNPTIEKLNRYFKNATTVLSTQRSSFKMEDYNLNSIYFDTSTNAFYIQDHNGDHDRCLYDCDYKQLAEILN